MTTTADLLAERDTFARRHLGPREPEIAEMLKLLGYATLDELSAHVVPQSIQLGRALNLPAARSESRALADLRAMAQKNEVFRSFIGQGYSACITPPVILRNVLENPGWYTQYTPYQAEIAQGRMEALINFQTMIADLTGLPLANASLLDEGTAVAEAMHMCQQAAKGAKAKFFLSSDLHPQSIAVVKTRALPLGIEVVVGDAATADFAEVFGVVVQYPTTDGRVEDYQAVADRAHAAGAMFVVAADLLALTLLKAPGEFGADVCVGSAQRFGVPMGFGGPHAAFLSTKDEFKRIMPGRLIGVSRDSHGRPGYRLSLQTREQHIRRDKATSNICTAQVLLAVMASMYAVYHGPDGLRDIARRVRALTLTLAAGLRKLGYDLGQGLFFDTLRVRCEAARADQLHAAAKAKKINLRRYPDGVGVSLDEASRAEDVADLLAVFAAGAAGPAVAELVQGIDPALPEAFERKSPFLTHPVFNSYHAEHEMLRYLNRLQARDLSLTTSMIPLGSCTMKLNATSEMIPVTWAEFGKLHPFAPAEQTKGYAQLFADLEAWLAEITGFAAVSLQPNAGAQGEYAGLLAIRGFHQGRGEGHRDVCLIPISAHGTNPASAVMAGFQVVVTACDAQGNVDLADLEQKAEQHRDKLGALMITYPSTHGVFEQDVKRICEIVHARGGQVYMDGANMNAQVGLTRPADIGADVCHLNLHKTFCIPHGGGGPGMGPIGVAAHLAPFLPGHPLTGAGAVSAAPWGSASILVISWMYIAMMGADGLKKATQVAILNANYMAKQLAGHYDVLYTGPEGRVAHEFILDTRPFKALGVEAEDFAKRLMDYGFHAPTMSFPVPGTLMIEPTESESKAELDRFCDAMIGIREEIRQIEAGTLDRADNPLKNAPHTAAAVIASDWSHKYSREQAAYPAPWLRENKFWPAVGRIDNVYGDRNLVCTCIPVEAFAS